MNLDRLIKLAKLANSNPNDHEANAAARKVCRMIAESNYNFSNTKIEEPSMRPRPETWNDVTRSGEPFWRMWEDTFGRAGRGYGSWRNPNTYQNNPPPPKPPPEPTRTEPPPNMNWDYGATENKKRYSRIYEPKNRDCTVCNLTKATTDTTTPYVCADCLWRRYHAEKGKEWP